jgi:hypothetical protein
VGQKSTLLKVGQTSVGQMSVGQMSVAEKLQHHYFRHFNYICHNNLYYLLNSFYFSILDESADTLVGRFSNLFYFFTIIEKIETPAGKINPNNFYNVLI